MLHQGLLPVKSGRYVSPWTYGEMGLLLTVEASAFDGQLCFLLLPSCLLTVTKVIFAFAAFSTDFIAIVNVDGTSSAEGRLVRFPRTTPEWDSTGVSGTTEEPWIAEYSLLRDFNECWSEVPTGTTWLFAAASIGVIPNFRQEIRVLRRLLASPTGLFPISWLSSELDLKVVNGLHYNMKKNFRNNM